MASLPRASRSAVVGPHRDGRSPMVRSTVPDLRNPTRPSRRFSCSAAATEPIIAQTPAAEMLMQELAACAAASKTGGLHQQSRVPVVVMFTASWCGPCQMMAKELNRLKEERGDEVKILFIDVDENKELAGALNVSTLPTTMFIAFAEENGGTRNPGDRDGEPHVMVPM
eukprot:gene12562-15785_t